MTENNQPKANERRQYYRIDDSVIFTYYVLNKEWDKNFPEKNKNISAAFETIELFAQMNQQVRGALGRISEHSADIASYLKSLDNKIELLAQMCLFKDRQSSLEQRKLINLGAGGLAFGSDEKFKKGSLLAIDMILSTDLLCLHLTGRVIQILNQKEEGYPYRISVSFIDISESEVDQIIKHIMRLQSEQLRAKREDSQR